MKAAAAVRKVPTLSELKRLALDASVDYRTLQALLDGRSVRGMAGDRGRQALIRAGYLAEGEDRK